jgi:hypothetical protein
MPAEAQERALDALMSALRLGELTLAPRLLGQIPPRPPGFGRTRELFPRTTGSIFDPISPAIVATDMVVSGLLTGERAARLVAQKALDPSLPGLGDVIERLAQAVFDAVPATPYEAEINRAMERVVIRRLMSLAQTASLTQVRAITIEALRGLQDRQPASITEPTERAHRQLMVDDVTRFLGEGLDQLPLAMPPAAPPGAPIGDTGLDYLLGLDACVMR